MTSLDRMGGYVFSIISKEGIGRIRDYLVSFGLLKKTEREIAEVRYTLKDGSVVMIKGLPARRSLFVPQSLDETTRNALFAEARLAS